MDLELAGKSVLVTGASRGIGFAAAVGFAAEGCRLHLAARSVPDLEAAAQRIRDAHGVGVVCHPTDLSDPAQCAALAASAGAIDVLVNNAGAIPGGSLARVDDDTWRKAWDLKMHGYINLTRAVYTAMQARGSGVIVNVIGMAGDRPWPGYIAGSTANAGLISFTRALGAEAPAHGLRVVGVNPGRTATERLTRLMMDQAQAKFGDRNRWQEIMQEAARNQPFGRLMRADEAADLIVFVASARASYISGTVINLDGGASLRASP